jgi:predicted amidohydrolase YtcJ
MNKIILLVVCFLVPIFSQDTRIAFYNGKVYTVNPNMPFAEAVVVEGNKIIFVGSNDEIKGYTDNTSKLIDLSGKLMLPGFIDNHVHFISGGFYLSGIDLRPAKSIKELREIMNKYLEKTEKGAWITGGEWDHEAWDVKEYPTKEMIDDITSSTPVFVTRFDGHMALANSYALKLAGINKDTPSPDGGVIVKDPKTGEPTGLLKDNAMSLVTRIIPEQSDNEVYEDALTALNEAKRLGVTSVHDITYSPHLRVYKQLDEEGKLTCRVYTRMPIAEYKALPDGIQRVKDSNKLMTGSLKAFADGSLGSSTAWFYEPYKQDTTTSGLAMDIVTDGRLASWAIDADKKKMQLSIHAIGDKANSYILDLYEHILKNNPQWERRFRIEHAQHVKFEDISRFKELGVIASCQPYHAIDDGVWAEKRIGEERIKYTYPFRSFIDSGVLLSFGSDWVVAPLNPLLGIYAATTRRTLDDNNPDGWIPEQKISVEEAIKCYTINNAYAAFEEDRLGSIEAGKFADLVVLDKDILTIDPAEIKDTKVILTIFDGEIIYQENK